MDEDTQRLKALVKGFKGDTATKYQDPEIRALAASVIAKMRGGDKPTPWREITDATGISFDAMKGLVGGPGVPKKGNRKTKASAALKAARATVSRPSTDLAILRGMLKKNSAATTVRYADPDLREQIQRVYAQLAAQGVSVSAAAKEIGISYVPFQKIIGVAPGRTVNSHAHPEVQEAQAAIAKLKKDASGSSVRFNDPELRSLIIAATSRLLAEGKTWNKAANELGVAFSTIKSICDDTEARNVLDTLPETRGSEAFSGRKKLGRPPGRGRGNAKGGGLALVTAGGHRVEGDVDSIAALLARL